MNRLFLLLFGMVTFVAHAQVPDYVPTEGLVGWYPLDGNALDFSSLSNDGSVHGATPTLDRYGNENGALNFDVNDWSWGSGGNWVYIPFHEEFNTPEVTVSTWVKRNSGGYEAVPQGLSVACRYQYGYSNPNGESWVLSIGNEDSSIGSRFLGYIIQQSPSPAIEISNISPEETPLLEWIMLTMTWDGDTLRLYQDGLMVSETIEPGFEMNTIGSSGISLGMSLAANGHWGPLDGDLDDFAVWNRALAAGEITALYNAPAPAPGCTDPIACNFDAEANEDDDSCVYPPSESVDCEFGGNYCGEGTIWDASLQTCVGIDDCPADLNGNGLVEVSDLLMVLAEFGNECPPEVAEWTCGDPVNYHGYDYATAQIGEQCWFAENLRYLPEVSPVDLGSEDDGMPHAYVYGYDGSSPVEAMLTENYATYGTLYNHVAIEAWSLCPEGWSSPTLEQWNILSSNHTAAECVSVEWFGNNQAGFNFLPGGNRDGIEGFNAFNNLGNAGLIWVNNPAKNVGVGFDQNWYEYENLSPPSFGFSIRCLKD